MPVSEAFNTRFGGISRLYGSVAAHRLRQAKICIVGLGGVGSWAAEALARSGIGTLSLVDLDDICVSNVNRQIHALEGEFGKPKVEMMARRIQLIHPDVQVKPVHEYLTECNVDNLLAGGFDYVLDAIDSVRNKCLLIAACRAKRIPIVTCGGAGGRRDPSLIKVADLALTVQDSLLERVRKKLRSDFNFPRDRKVLFQVDCVFTTEPPVFPQGDGTVGAKKAPDTDPRINCDTGYGTATFITGTFGFVAASVIVNKIAQTESSPVAL